MLENYQLNAGLCGKAEYLKRTHSNMERTYRFCLHKISLSTR